MVLILFGNITTNLKSIYSLPSDDIFHNFLQPKPILFFAVIKPLIPIKMKRYVRPDHFFPSLEGKDYLVGIKAFESVFVPQFEASSAVSDGVLDEALEGFDRGRVADVLAVVMNEGKDHEAPNARHGAMKALSVCPGTVRNESANDFVYLQAAVAIP